MRRSMYHVRYVRTRVNMVSAARCGLGRGRSRLARKRKKGCMCRLDFWHDGGRHQGGRGRLGRGGLPALAATPGLRSWSAGTAGAPAASGLRPQPARSLPSLTDPLPPTHTPPA